METKDKLNFTTEPTLYSFGMDYFMKRVVDNNLPFIQQESYFSTSPLDSLKELATIHLSKGLDDDLLIQVDDALVRLYRGNSADVNMWIAAASRESIKEAKDFIHEHLPVFDKEEENVVPITFWANTHNGPMQISRRIDVPSWKDIEENYTPAMREKLDHMMNDFKPSFGGQLVLWEGSPGTGKTYCLRSLADSWRKWAKFHYITDPETFFGDAAYMIQVLLQETQYYSPDDNGEEEEEAWKVLILEDCGELLSADAKERTGQAVARLLNVVDGLIGQGLKILVLVTTNEPVKKFHPAVTRPGRCALHLEYKSFSTDEANEWLAAHDSDERVTEKSITLAELFGRVEGYSLEDVKKPAGFA